MYRVPALQPINWSVNWRIYVNLCQPLLHFLPFSLFCYRFLAYPTFCLTKAQLFTTDMFHNKHPKHLIVVGFKRMSDRAAVSFADVINVKMSVRLLVQQCTAARLRLPSDETLEIGGGMVVFVCFNKVIRHPFLQCCASGSVCVWASRIRIRIR